MTCLAFAGRRGGVCGIGDAVKSGGIPEAQIDTSVERILRAKARAGLHATTGESRRDPPCRRPRATGDRRRVSQRSITLVKDERTRCR